MKKNFTYLTIIALVVLSACGQQQSNPQIPTTPTVQATNTPEPTITPAEVPERFLGWTALTEEEIQYFNEEYFTTETEFLGRWIRSNLLYLEFTKPSQVDLEVILYNETQMGEEELSAEEIAYLKEQGAIEELDTFKLSTAYIEEVLQSYLGISLEESEKKGLEKFIYNEETDAYYSVHSDTLACFVLVEEGYRNEDSTIVLLYKKAEVPWKHLQATEIEQLPQYQVMLQETEDGYQFLSNQIVEDSD